jgi:tRNA G26 N,N-dimethylase Trm1
MSVFDGHHTRVSVLVTPGKKNASNVYENLGWRVNKPDSKTIAASIKAGLHSFKCSKMPQPRAFLPYTSPPESLADGNVSGPLWIGPIAREDVLEELTEEYALEICGLSLEKDAHIISLAGWKKEDVEISNKGIVRSIERLHQSKDAVNTNGLVTVDELPQWVDIGGPPSPKKLIAALKEKGFEAAISLISTPAIQTNATWDIVMEVVKEMEGSN